MRHTAPRWRVFHNLCNGKAEVNGPTLNLERETAIFQPLSEPGCITNSSPSAYWLLFHLSANDQTRSCLRLRLEPVQCHCRLETAFERLLFSQLMQPSTMTTACFMLYPLSSKPTAWMEWRLFLRKYLLPPRYLSPCFQNRWHTSDSIRLLFLRETSTSSRLICT